jgi:hypothetical protein
MASKDLRQRAASLFLSTRGANGGAISRLQ